MDWNINKIALESWGFMIELKASFRIITQDFTGEELNELLSMKCDFCNKYETKTIWILNSSVDSYKPLEEHLISLLSQVKPNLEKILMMKSDSFIVDILLGVFSEKSQPGISITQQAISILDKMKVNLEICFYDLSEY